MKYHKNEIVERIEELRKKRKEEYKNGKEKYIFCVNKEYFSSEIGVNRKTYYSWLKEGKLPSLEVLIEICDKLECTLNYLLGIDDLPFTKTISDVSRFTKIAPEIIESIINDKDYLDFLNFFMLPDNCEDLFHKIYLSEWKSFLISDRLSSISSDLLITIQKAFDKFYSIEDPNNLNIEVFKKYLKEFIPYGKVIFINTKGHKDKNHLYICNCFSKKTYEDFISKCPHKKKYIYFIDYIASLTYSSLINSIYLEIQKEKINDSFTQLLDKYISELRANNIES